MATPTKPQRRARPSSPLPDSSILEAGLLTDANDIAARSPSMTLVYDQVRDLLRHSFFGRIEDSPGSIPSPPAVRRALSRRSSDSSSSSEASPALRGCGGAWNASMSVAAAASEQLQEQLQRRGTQTPEFAVVDEKKTLEGPMLAATAVTMEKAPVVVVTSIVPPPPPPPPPPAMVSGTLFPPLRTVQSSNYNSTLFNTRAFQALDHPNLNDPSLGFLSRQKNGSNDGDTPPQGEQRQGTVRPKPSPRSHRKHRSGRAAREAARRATNQTIVSVFAALFLSGLVAIYLAFSFGKPAQPHGPVFHVLFALGIVAAAMILGYTLWRMFKTNVKSSGASQASSHQHRCRRSDEENLLWVDGGDAGEADTQSRRSASTRSQRSHRGRERSRRRVASPTNQTNGRPVPPPLPAMPTITVDPNFDAFVPTEPIQVHGTAAANSGTGPTLATAVDENVDNWSKPATSVIHPPPAYGRWRGSVLANPDLLHWQAVHNAATDVDPALPSPAYVAEVDDVTSAAHDKQVPTAEAAPGESAMILPPTYYKSPSRMKARVAEAVQVQAVEPEMIEVKMVGVGRSA